MSVVIIKPGILDSLQDAGRYGYSHWGINPGGAMDSFAATVANALVCNKTTETVLELHFPASQLLFEQNSLISICGADFTPVLDGAPIPLWQPILIRKNSILHFRNQQKGARCYIAVHGGFEAAEWLGSSSTHLKLALSGFNGRRLEKNDQLLFKEPCIYFASLLSAGKPFRILNWGASVYNTYAWPNEIFFIPGPQINYLAIDAKELGAVNFTIHPSSDRMGYHLRGEALTITHTEEIISTGVTRGTIQLLPSGQLVVLMADHQTTGGYPIIGTCIQAHLPKLAQLRASEAIQLLPVDMESAEELYCQQQNDLQLITENCQLHLKELLCKA
ncbi:MAG: biotin-dependent carboxyltransferase family protein [Flavihumibacter sp.]|nr:biotin-dependent carboxyltransferase family protein [Flavihumibacter sp.]